MLAWHREFTGAPSAVAKEKEVWTVGELGKEWRKGDARVQFSLRLLESGYVRLVRSPVSPRDREPCGWPATQTRSLTSTGSFCLLRGSIPLSILSPSPLPPINLPASHRVSFLRTARLALSRILHCAVYGISNKYRGHPLLLFCSILVL